MISGLSFIISKVSRQLVRRPSCDSLTHGRIYSRSHSSAEHTTTLLDPFNGLFSTTTWVNRYQKGKTSLDLKEARDGGVMGCSGISWTICKQSAPRSRQITTPTPHHSIIYRPDALPDAQPTVKALKAQQLNTVIIFYSPTCDRDKQTND